MGNEEYEKWHYRFTGDFQEMKTPISVYFGKFGSLKKMLEYYIDHLDSLEKDGASITPSLLGDGEDLFKRLSESKSVDFSDSFFNEFRRQICKAWNPKKFNTYVIADGIADKRKPGAKFGKLKLAFTTEYEPIENDDEGNDDSDPGRISIWFGSLEGTTIKKYIRFDDSKLQESDDMFIDDDEIQSPLEIDFKTGYYDEDFVESYTAKAPVPLEKLLKKTGWEEKLREDARKAAAKKKIVEGTVLLGIFQLDAKKRKCHTKSKAQPDFHFLGSFDDRLD